MPENVALHELVGSVAGAIVDAQGLVEKHFIEQVSHYFDREGRPISLALKIPRASSESPGEYQQIAVPLLSLVESTMLGIKDMRIELEVELGSVTDNPALPARAPIGPSNPQAAGAPMAAATPLAEPAFRSAGAPIDVPWAGATPLPDPAAAPMAPAAAPMTASVPRPPSKLLTLGIGSRQDSAPRARLTINVAAQPPSEGMLRLLTQLNKLV